MNEILKKVGLYGIVPVVKIDDAEKACVNAAKALVLMADILLRDDAAMGKKVVAEATPVYPSQEAFLAAIDKLMLDKDAVIYNEDGTVTLDYKN